MMNKILEHLRENWIRHGFETLVVVVGIVVAFGLNNWNENRKERKKEKELLEELVINLEANAANLTTDINFQLEQIEDIKFLLDHLENKRPYVDSMTFMFMNVEIVPDIVLASSAFETLRSAGLDIISENELRKVVVELFEITYPYLLQNTKRLEDQMWPSVVLPLTTKHFRYRNGRPYPVKYELLVEDSEYLNMVSARLGHRVNSTRYKREARKKTQEVIDLIAAELRPAD